jgi:biopolymer transport protein ExbD
VNGLQALVVPMVASTLVVLTAVAGLPALLLASTAPRPRNPPLGPEAGIPLQVVRSAKGRWFLNGQPVGEASLARVLRQFRVHQATVRFQASGALPVGEVSRAMDWLRRQSGRPVSLDLPVVAP